jgi:sugar (pentulose or hexulose) kinase
MDLRSCQWCEGMLEALAWPEYRELAWKQLPRIVAMDEPIGPLSDSLAEEIRLGSGPRPLIFPTLDDQAAGLVGGGAVDAGQVALILGNSAVVNSSSSQLPQSGNLDAMRLNWGPYLWMRCYNNGAQFFDRIVGTRPNWETLERQAREVPPGCSGTAVLPFAYPEPSCGIPNERVDWFPEEPTDPGVKYRAALEALAYLMARGVREHEAAGQKVTRLTVSGGIARSDLMCEILASVIDRPLERLQSFEGPALGAAVIALAGLETRKRQEAGITEPFTVADAVAVLVKFRTAVQPNPAWREAYQAGWNTFEQRLVKTE